MEGNQLDAVGRTGLAVVTGGTRGIGLAIARVLAAEGRPVVIAGSQPGGVERAVAELRADGFEVDGRHCDLADRAAVCALSEDLASLPVEVLVNNAGIGILASLTDTTDERWDATIDIDLTAAFILARGLVPPLARSGAGAIVNILSFLALQTTAGLSAYAAAKGGLAQLTRALAVELGPVGIRSNAVAPGFIETDLFRSHHPPERQRLLAAAHPLGRVGTVEEVASTVAFLCGAGASFVNGAVLTVDGGLSCRAAIPPLLAPESD